MKSYPNLSRIFWESDEVLRIPRKPDQDIRDYPSYTIPEAAAFLAISRRTLYHWVSDDPLWESAGKNEDNRLLSFRDVAQSYFVDFIRRQTHTSARSARQILDIAKKETGKRYPLLDKNVKFVLRHIVLDRPAKGKRKRQVVDLSHLYPQTFLPEVVDLFATRFVRNKKSEQLFPWRFYDVGKDESTPVMLDPDILSGRLVITGTRIPVSVVWNRRESGEEISDIAKDYGLEEKNIKDALRHIALPLRKAS